MTLAPSLRRTVPRILNSREMHEYIFPVFTLNEAEALRSVKPLDNTGFLHVTQILLMFELSACGACRQNTIGRPRR